MSPWGWVQVSGAYVFRPRADHPVSLELGVNPGQDEFFDATPVPPVRVFTGPVVVEVHRYEANWGGQVYRFYKDEPGVEMEYVVSLIILGAETPGGGNLGISVRTRLRYERDFVDSAWYDLQALRLRAREGNQRCTASARESQGSRWDVR